MDAGGTRYFLVQDRENGPMVPKIRQWIAAGLVAKLLLGALSFSNIAESDHCPDYFLGFFHGHGG